MRTFVLLATLGAVNLIAQARPRPAVPAEAVTAVLDAFRLHPVVALGEGNHNNEQGHAFRLSLVRDQRFANVVNDIVVEFGSARYQDIMDRYVQGVDVPDAQLRQAWENTTQGHSVWDVPIYREFFQAVRTINAALPVSRRIRVLLGDPPLDWGSIRSTDDVRSKLSGPEGNRDGHATALIQREVLGKGRRALLIYGEIHLTRFNPFGAAIPTGGSIVERLTGAGAKVFSIWTYTLGGDLATKQTDVPTWPAPSLVALKGTVLGAAEFGFYYPFEIISKDQRIRATAGTPMEAQFDALLYLGPPSSITYSKLSREQCADTSYLAMRTRRMVLMTGDTSASGEGQSVRKYCASLGR